MNKTGIFYFINHLGGKNTENVLEKNLEMESIWKTEKVILNRNWKWTRVYKGIVNGLKNYWKGTMKELKKVWIKELEKTRKLLERYWKETKHWKGLERYSTLHEKDKEHFKRTVKKLQKDWKESGNVLKRN